HSRHEDDGHPFTFKSWKLLYLPVFLQRLGELKQQYFTPLLIDYRPADKGYSCLNLCPFLQEVHGMLHLKTEVMLFRIGAKANLLQYYLLCLSLDLLLLLLLLVLELGVVNNLADRRVSIR